MSKFTNKTFLLWFMMPLKRHIRGILAVAVLAMLAGAGRAQTTGAISGTVRDTMGAVVPDAKVVAIDEASQAEWTVVSNGAGFFTFSGLQPATYTVRVRRKGFASWSVTGIVLHPGDDLSIPKIALKVGGADISITVKATTAGVTLDSPEHSTLITSDEINRLSTIGRDVDELVAILPGFTLNAGTDMQNEGPGGLYGYQVVGPGNGQLGSWGAGGAAPQQGLLNLKSDGANLTDPGDMGGQLSNVNMDQVQEVKVSTSNFGADQSKGPIVIDAVGKTGSAQFHGSLYTYFRNSALNSNDWLSKYEGSPRPAFRFFYPGVTIGGPVVIPHTQFNAKKKLVFWVGFEDYRQLSPEGSLVQAFVPNAAMLGGDLSPSTIAAALNVPLTGANGLTTNCAADWNVQPTYNDLGGDCYSPNGSTDVMGNTVNNGKMPYVDPATTTISRLWPTANRTPQPVYSGGQLLYQSDGVNFVQNVSSTNNGFQLHDTEDYNFTDTLKLHVAYDWERMNNESQLQDLYYQPGGTVPYPTPLYSNGHNQQLSLNLTKSIGSSLTNELVGAGVFYYQPAQFADPAKVQTTGTTWASAGYSGGALGLDESQLPKIYSYESTSLPNYSFGYVPPGSQFLRKFDLNVADNLTKVYKTHTIKVGFYVEQAGNSNETLASQVNGTFTFARWDSCYVNQLNPNAPGAPPVSPGPSGAPSTFAGMGNTIGNFLMGCPGGYSQDSSDPVENLRFRTFEGYGTDEWKLNSKLTLTLGVRISHLTPWYDPHGIGIAVWDPSGVPQHVLNPFGAVTQSNTTWPGVYWHGRNPEVPNAGYPTRAAFYQPRGGLAYDLLGNGKTVFRGGWGMYVSHDSAAVAGGEASAIGLETYTPPGTVSCSFGQLFLGVKYLPCGYYATSQSSVAPFTLNLADPKDDNMPVTYNYNFTIDQQGPWKSTFEVAYVGSRTQHLLTEGNLQNQDVIPLGAMFAPDPVTGFLNPPGTLSTASNTADYRPYPNYAAVNVPSHTIWANYNSLQAQWNKQTGALVYGINYTWSKSLGVRGNWDTGAVADPVDPHHDYGITSFDRPQALNVVYSYEEGTKFHGNRVLGQILNGWEVSGVTSLQTGPDLSVLNGSTNYNLSGSFGYYVGTTEISEPIGAAEWLGSSDYTLQPVVTCDPRKGLKKDQFVNGSCFAMPQIGTQGWWNLPDVRGPSYFKSDLSIYKNFKINERQNLQFRGSGFNFLNHPLVSFNNSNLGTMYLTAADCGASVPTASCPQYASISQALQNVAINNAGTFGYTSYKDGVRIVELAFKYTF